METLTIAVACIDSPINSSIHNLIAIHSSFKIIGEAKTGEELLELIYRAKPNIIIVDYDLPSIHSTIFNSAYKDYLPDFQLILVGKDKNRRLKHLIIQQLVICRSLLWNHHSYPFYIK
ncbi:hypothetical protein AAHB53_18750 [Niallia circulans]